MHWIFPIRIHWIAIYLVIIAIQPLNKWGKDLHKLDLGFY